MPSRYYLRQFYPDTFHHIYNRGAYKQKIFITQKDYQTFLDILSYYLKFPTGKPFVRAAKKFPTNSPACPLLAFCLMPNHFHLLIQQVNNQPTIANLLKRVSITYAMYFQEKHQHSGALFQSKYKSISVQSENQLLYLSKYIHLNPTKMTGTVPYIYSYSSLKDYINLTETRTWIHPEIILNAAFPNSPNPGTKYQKFVLDINDQNSELIQPVTID
ncbi:MAG: transposase [Candidatus Beckwithbacteria bacterium]|nr:transposase [Candidatus Beckwithbacteria bacterium]